MMTTRLYNTSLSSLSSPAAAPAAAAAHHQPPHTPMTSISNQPFAASNLFSPALECRKPRRGLPVPLEVGRYAFSTLLHKPTGEIVMHVWLPGLDPTKHIHCGIYKVKEKLKDNPYDVNPLQLPSVLKENREYGRLAVPFYERYGVVGAAHQFSWEYAQEGTKIQPEHIKRTDGRGCSGLYLETPGVSPLGQQIAENKSIYPALAADNRNKVPSDVLVPYKPMIEGLGKRSSPECPVLVVTAPKNTVVQKWERLNFPNRVEKGIDQEYLWIQRAYRLYENHDVYNIVCEYLHGLLRVFVPVKTNPPPTAVDAVSESDLSETKSTVKSGRNGNRWTNEIVECDGQRSVESKEECPKMTRKRESQVEREQEVEEKRNKWSSTSFGFGADGHYTSYKAPPDLPYTFPVYAVRDTTTEELRSIVMEQMYRNASSWIYNWEKFSKYDPSIDMEKTNRTEAVHELQAALLRAKKEKADDLKRSERENLQSKEKNKREKIQNKKEKRKEEWTVPSDESLWGGRT